MPGRHDRTVDALLARHGQMYAAQAGLRLTDKPAPLFGLLVLSVLLSTRISGDIAVNAAKALRKAGWTTARSMSSATWEERTRTLNQSGYARYDESTSRMLGEVADRVQDRYRGDLRRLRAEADGDARKLRALLKEFKGIGDVGADIFCREAQLVWPELYPFLDQRAADGAKAVGLPSSARGLSGLVDRQTFPTLVAACLRVRLAKDADEVKAAARGR